MNGARLAILALIGAMSPVAAAACGDDSQAVGTLPPIVTTSTTTTMFITTTTVHEFYIVKRGDTLGQIARAFQVRVADLQSLNGIVNADDIQAGQELQIPTGAVVFDTLPLPVTTPATT